MATKTVVCPDCQETVPYGRLSCPSCGALLAAVAGAVRRTEPLKVVDVTEEPLLAEDVPPAPPEVVRPAPPVRRRTRAATAAAAALAANAPQEPDAHSTEAETTPDDSMPLAADAETPASEPAPVEVQAVAPVPAAPAPATAPQLAPRTVRTVPAGSAPPVLRDWPADTPLPTALAGGSRTFESEESWDDGEDADAPDSEAEAEASARPEAPPRPPSRPDAAGAYLPPSATLRPTPADGSVAGGAAYGRATATPMRSEPITRPAPQPAMPVAEAKPKLKAGEAPFLADLPFDAPNTLPGWLIVAGSAIVSISFFLPWSELLLGGGQLNNTFTDGWGLGNSSHLLVLLASVSVLALTLVPNRLPSWVSSGILPILLGGLVLGLVWPYFFANFARVGALLAAGGAVVLAIGGMLSLKPPRHDEGGTGV